MKAPLLLVLVLPFFAGCTAAEWCKDGHLYYTGAERDQTRSGCAYPSHGCAIYFYSVHQWQLQCNKPDGTVEQRWWDEKPTDQRPPAKSRGGDR